MTDFGRLGLVFGLLTIAIALGLVWRARTGKSKSVASGDVIDLNELAAIKDGSLVKKFGRKTTFLQFSSEVCSACRATAKVYSELEKSTDGLLHIEVDITRRLDLAKKYQILQTPTTLVLDPSGRVVSRIGGAPKPQTIQTELEGFEI